MPKPKTNRRGFLTAIGAGSLVSTAGCLGDTDDELNTELAISLYPIITATTWMAVAIERDMFSEHGVDVEELVTFSGGGETVRGVTTGGIGIGCTALPALVTAHLEGSPVNLGGLVMHTPDIDFEARPDSDIESIQDMEGRTIAVTDPASSGEACAMISIQNAEGISLDDVEFLYAGGLGECLTAVIEGDADVTFNIPPISTEMLANNDLRRVWHTRDYEDDFSEFVLAFSTSVLDDSPDLARGIVNTFIDSFEFVQNNLEDSARIWGEVADVPEDIAIEALEDVNPADTYNIQLDENVLRNTVGTMITADVIDEEPPWNELIRQDAIPENYRVDWFE